MKDKDISIEKLEFMIFSIEAVAQRLGVKPKNVYEFLAKDSDILYSYVLPCYEILHTQGKEYIVNDILEVMKEKGVKYESISWF